jgi:AcrR family transcriptional regulator
MENIWHLLGVSKGVLYLYFENKEELFKAIVEKAQLDLQDHTLFIHRGEASAGPQHVP